MSSSTKLNKEQQRVLTGTLDRLKEGKRLTTIGGLAGTGKTELVAALAECLPNFRVCALTGKASAVLGSRGVDAATLHSTIYTTRQTALGPQFDLRLDFAPEGLIIDEASMISTDIRADLRQLRVPMVLVGDHGQLPPVGGDPKLMRRPHFKLQKLHRNPGPIARFAMHLRAGKPANSFPQCDEVRVFKDEDAAEELMLRADQIIVGFNPTKVRINKDVRAWIECGESVEEGDRVICLQNRREIGLLNGQQFTVAKVRGDRFDLLDECGNKLKSIRFDPAAFHESKPSSHFLPYGPVRFDFAYAITCHRAQGSEWDEVVVIEQQCPAWNPERWSYTAAARARRRLTWIIQDS